MGSSNSTKVTVIRHGETLWNREGRQQGQLDSGLSELGIKQAEAIASGLEGKHFDAFYSSDLGRAVQTAQIISKRINLGALTDSRLRERHLGIMQTLTMAEFAKEYPEEYEKFNSGDPDYALPEGESARERYERSIECLEELAARHAGEEILIVTHGGILNSIFRHSAGIDIATPRPFSLFNASINTFSVIDGKWCIDSWGDVHHLGELDTLDDN